MAALKLSVTTYSDDMQPVMVNINAEVTCPGTLVRLLTDGTFIYKYISKHW